MAHLAPQAPPTPDRPARTLVGRPLAVAIGVGVLALAAAGFAIAALSDGPQVAPQAPAATAALHAGSDVLGSYPQHVDQFAGTDPWPADQGEFRRYTTWLAQNDYSDVDPAALATITYTLTSSGPCLATFDTQTRAAVTWAGGELSGEACTAAP